MAYVAFFSGVEDQVQRCAPIYYWTIYPTVKDREYATIKVGEITFRVEVAGQTLQIQTDKNEQCFTLVFSDTGNYDATVTHEASGFTGGVSRSGAQGNKSTVYLSKPWTLDIVVQEKWKDRDPSVFAGAKVKVAGVEVVADGDGKGKKEGLALRTDTLVKLDVKGLDASKCAATVVTGIPHTEDGFLRNVDTTTEEKDQKSEVTLNVVQPGSTVKITFVMQVNAITPKLDPEKVLALLYYGDTKEHKTSLTEVEVKYDTTYVLKDKKDVEDDLKGALTFESSKIECFKDDKATKAHTSKTAVAWKDMTKFHVKGKAKDETDLSLTLSTARAVADRSWRIKGDTGWTDETGEVKTKVWVEKLELAVFKYVEGKSVADADYANTKVASDAVPKTRELHNRNDQIFTVAKLTVKKPGARFWELAESVKLGTESTVSVWKEKGCTTTLTELKETAFTTDPLPIWVRGDGSAALDAEGGGQVNWNAWVAKTPEKATTSGYALLGAKLLSKKEILRGDCVTLETYSFDKHLDRKTRNECGTRLIAAYNNQAAYLTVTTKDVALARAGGHKYYDLESGFHINKNYSAAGFSIFQAFINSMNIQGNYDSWSLAGTNFVAGKLQEHGIGLHATTRGMIRDYIRRVLMLDYDYANNFGFDVTRGVPGVHAEVLAVNEILSQGVPIDEVTVATYRLQDSLGGQGKRFIACTNCAGILLGGATAVRVITG